MNVSRTKTNWTKKGKGSLMLQLWRREGDSVEIPDLDVRFVITELDWNQQCVLVGVSAPKEYTILRGELVKRPTGRASGRHGYSKVDGNGRYKRDDYS